MFGSLALACCTRHDSWSFRMMDLDIFVMDWIDREVCIVVGGKYAGRRRRLLLHAK